MVNRRSNRWVGLHVLCVVASAVLSGCLDDGSPSSAAVTAPAANTAAATANRAPTITGAAASSTAIGASYVFAPVGADADGNTLSFSIDNRPSWATFSTVTGRLTGTPTAGDVGTYANIVIRVSDGSSTVSLPAFAISVTQMATGAATLSWLPPTENEDGSPLTDLAGYYIYYGTDESALTQRIRVDNASVSRYLVENLSPSTWYFSIKAFSSTGAESAFSAIASKSIS